MRYLFLLLVIMPVLEIWLILKVGAAVGANLAFGLILVTAVFGALVLRQQGVATVFRARQKLTEGKLPAEELLAGLMIVIAGALMLTPGFVTDGIGFIVLVPAFRAVLIRKFQRRILRAVVGEHQGHYSDDTIIEGEYYRQPRGDENTSDKKLGERP